MCRNLFVHTRVAKASHHTASQLILTLMKAQESNSASDMKKLLRPICIGYARCEGKVQLFPFPLRKLQRIMSLWPWSCLKFTNKPHMRWLLATLKQGRLLLKINVPFLQLCNSSNCIQSAWMAHLSSAPAAKLSFEEVQLPNCQKCDPMENNAKGA